MANVDVILKKISEETDGKAKSILDVAKNEADAKIELAGKQIEKECSVVIEDAKKHCEELIKRNKAICDLENRKAMLSVKHKVLQDTFVLAKKRVEEMENKQDFIKKLLELNAQGNEKVMCATADKDYFSQDFLNSVGKNLVFDGVSDKISGGFLLISENTEINCSYDAVVEQVKQEIESEVAKILFD